MLYFRALFGFFPVYVYFEVVFMACQAVFASQEIVGVFREFVDDGAIIRFLSVSRTRHELFFTSWAYLRWQWIERRRFQEAVEQAQEQQAVEKMEIAQDVEAAELREEEDLLRFRFLLL